MRTLTDAAAWDYLRIHRGVQRIDRCVISDPKARDAISDDRDFWQRNVSNSSNSGYVELCFPNDFIDAIKGLVEPGPGLSFEFQKTTIPAEIRAILTDPESTSRTYIKSLGTADPCFDRHPDAQAMQFGCFAKQDIPKLTVVGQYAGVVILPEVRFWPELCVVACAIALVRLASLVMLVFKLAGLAGGGGCIYV